MSYSDSRTKCHVNYLIIISLYFLKDKYLFWNRFKTITILLTVNINLNQNYELIWFAEDANALTYYRSEP